MDRYHIHLYGPDRGPLPDDFETVAGRLETIDRLYFEPDGSFVCSADGPRGQAFGMVYDAAGRVQYVEIRGSATAGTFGRIVAACGASDDATVVRLPGGTVKTLQAFVVETFDGDAGR